jgi:hypothetical protein
VLWCARDVERKRGYLTVLADPIFVGGIGRLLSTVTVGIPHPLYFAMLAVDLVLPAGDRVGDQKSRSACVSRSRKYDHGMRRTLLVVFAIVASGLIVSIASPAWACGCGAYVPDSPGASVADERALITWDGRNEDILMSFNISGRSDRAAWVMPVPSAAQVSLGDAKVFDELAAMTAPRLEFRDSWWPTFSWLMPQSASQDTAGAPRGAPVAVLSSQRIGPFDVTRLATDDPTALAKWLSDNGFPHPPDLDRNLAPYVTDGWEIVAIKLVPAAQGQSLTGDLQPLRLSFDTDIVVYPMRLSRSASTPQSVDLYVLADHRMDATNTPLPESGPSLEFAGRIDVVDESSPLAPYLGDGAFLTRWTQEIPDPQSIDDDYVFVRAAMDETFQRVIHRTRNRGDITGLILIGAIVAGGVIGAVAVGRRISHG